MSSGSAALAASAGIALVLLDSLGSYVLGELGLGDRLFTGDGAGLFVALLVLVVVVSRLLLAFVVPGVVAASVVHWVFRRMR